VIELTPQQQLVIIELIHVAVPVGDYKVILEGNKHTGEIALDIFYDDVRYFRTGFIYEAPYEDNVEHVEEEVEVVETQDEGMVDDDGDGEELELAKKNAIMNKVKQTVDDEESSVITERKKQKVPTTESYLFVSNDTQNSPTKICAFSSNTKLPQGVKQQLKGTGRPNTPLRLSRNKDSSNPGSRSSTPTPSREGSVVEGRRNKVPRSSTPFNRKPDTYSVSHVSSTTSRNASTTRQINFQEGPTKGNQERPETSSEGQNSASGVNEAPTGVQKKNAVKNNKKNNKIRSKDRAGTGPVSVPFHMA